MEAGSTNMPDEESKDVWQVLEELRPHWNPWVGSPYVLLAPPIHPDGDRAVLDGPFDAVIHFPYEESELPTMGDYTCNANTVSDLQNASIAGHAEFFDESGWYLRFRDISVRKGDGDCSIYFRLFYKPHNSCSETKTWKSTEFSSKIIEKDSIESRATNTWINSNNLKDNYDKAREGLTRDRLGQLFPEKEKKEEKEEEKAKGGAEVKKEGNGLMGRLAGLVLGHPF